MYYFLYFVWFILLQLSHWLCYGTVHVLWIITSCELPSSKVRTLSYWGHITGVSMSYAVCCSVYTTGVCMWVWGMGGGEGVKSFDWWTCMARTIVRRTGGDKLYVCTDHCASFDIKCLWHSARRDRMTETAVNNAATMPFFNLVGYGSPRPSLIAAIDIHWSSKMPVESIKIAEWNLAEGWVMKNEWSCNIFGKIAPGDPEKGAKYHPFSSWIPRVTGLVISDLLSDFREFTWIHVPMKTFVAKFWKFSVKEMLFSKKNRCFCPFLVASVKFCGQ